MKSWRRYLDLGLLPVLLVVTALVSLTAGEIRAASETADKPTTGNRVDGVNHGR